MSKVQTFVGVHRFGDALALSDQRTVYLDIKSARRLHRAIGRICRSIEREDFVNSGDLTDHQIPKCEHPGDLPGDRCGRDPTIKRRHGVEP